MTQSEDILLDEYVYAWPRENSEVSLQDFLAKYKPSMVQDDGTKPWIWVRGPGASATDKNVEIAVEEARNLLTEVTEKVEAIKNDESIPVRSNKKTGAKSKKEVREKAQSEAAVELKDISIRNGFVSGKWLIFASNDKVDMIWSGLATSLVSGSLSKTCAFEAKVSTCPKNEAPNSQHVLCLYMPDVYDQDKVTEVMKILLGEHGMTLSGVKSNLYTAIGLDSKHACGIQSTVWKNTALMKDGEIKELKDAYFASLSATKSKIADKAEEKTAITASKPKKPVLKKKVAEADPFASDEDEPSEPRVKDSSHVEASAGTKRPAASRDQDEDEEQRPKKKGGI